MTIFPHVSSEKGCELTRHDDLETLPLLAENVLNRNHDIIKVEKRRPARADARVVHLLTGDPRRVQVEDKHGDTLVGGSSRSSCDKCVGRELTLCDPLLLAGDHEAPTVLALLGHSGEARHIRPNCICVSSSPGTEDTLATCATHMELTIRLGNHKTMLLITNQEGSQVLSLLLLGGVRGQWGAASRGTTVDTPDHAKIAAASNFIDQLLVHVLVFGGNDAKANVVHTIAS